MRDMTDRKSARDASFTNKSLTNCGSVGSHTSSTWRRAKICCARQGQSEPTPFRIRQGIRREVDQCGLTGLTIVVMCCARPGQTEPTPCNIKRIDKDGGGRGWINVD